MLAVVYIYLQARCPRSTALPCLSNTIACLVTNQSIRQSIIRRKVSSAL